MEISAQGTGLRFYSEGTQNWSGKIFTLLYCPTAISIANLSERISPLPRSLLSVSLSLSLPFPSPLFSPLSGCLVPVHIENSILENSTQRAFNYNALHVVIQKIVRTIMLFKTCLPFNALVSLPLCFRLNITQFPARPGAFSPIIWKAQRTVLTSKPGLMTKDTWPLQTQASLSSSLHLAKSYFHLSHDVTKD